MTDAIILMVGLAIYYELGALKKTIMCVAAAIAEQAPKRTQKEIEKDWKKIADA